MLLNGRGMEDSSAQRIVLSIEDITEHKRAEEALHTTQQRFDIVRDASEVGFWFCDLPFADLIWDNRVKEHFWLPPDAPVTIETFYERLHPDDRTRTKEAIERSISNNTRYEIEYRTLSPERKEKWIRAIGRTFYDQNQKPIRFDGVTLDITERKQAEQELRQTLIKEESARRQADEAREALRRLNDELEQRVAERTQELAQSEDRLRSLATELNLAEQRERTRLATELHDYLAQLLVLGRLSLSQAKRTGLPPRGVGFVNETEEILNKSLTYCRTLMAELNPPVLRDQGLKHI
jgi:signal transduction histidine kinase